MADWVVSTFQTMAEVTQVVVDRPIQQPPEVLGVSPAKVMVDMAQNLEGLDGFRWDSARKFVDGQRWWAFGLDPIS